MIRKKNKFFTLIFSAFFGAGQMYMGFMKQGISIMTLTAIILAFGNFTGIGTIFFSLPVLWFYSFFDVINKMTMPDHIFQTLEDHYIFLSSNDNIELKSLVARYEKAIAIFLILLGVSALGENILDLIAEQASMAGYYELSEFVYSLRWNGTRILFSILIIIVGAKMIIGKKKELDMEDIEYSGPVNNRQLMTDNMTDNKENTDENA